MDQETHPDLVEHMLTTASLMDQLMRRLQSESAMQPRWDLSLAITKMEELQDRYARYRAGVVQ